MTTTGIALLSGAGLEPTIWDELRSQISLPSIAVTYPDQKGQGRKGLRLRDYSQHVTQQLEDWDDVEEILLVAHSIGGTIGLAVASELSRVKGFIGIAAAIPKDGGSFVSTLPIPKRLIMTAVLRVVGTRPPDSAIRASLCHGLDEYQADKIVREFTPESKGIYTESTTYRLDIPCHYIRTLRDKEFTTDQMTQMAGNLPEAAIADIDAGHLPMIEQPAELATLIDRIVESTSAPSEM